MYRRLGGESAPAPPRRTGKSFRFFRACARCILCQFGEKKSWSGPVSFIFLPRGSVSFIFEKWLYLVSQRISEDLRGLKESSRREFSKRVLKDSFQREFSKDVLKESSQRVVSERFPQIVLKRILKVSSRRELKGVIKEMFQREF